MRRAQAAAAAASHVALWRPAQTRASRAQAKPTSCSLLAETSEHKTVVVSDLS